MHDNKGRYFEEIKKWTKKYEATSPSKITASLSEEFGKGFAQGISKPTSNNVCVEFSGRDFLDIIKQISDGYKLIADVEKYHAEHKSDNQ
jgi:hypothetical protein